MPTYDYDCATCGGFDALRSLAARNDAAVCPGCGDAAVRCFASAPRLALLEGDTRTAMDANERARHEPMRSTQVAPLRHSPGCACCVSGKRKATVTGANGNKAFPSRRPWMISH